LQIANRKNRTVYTPVPFERRFEKSIHIPYIYCTICRTAGDFRSSRIEGCTSKVTTDLEVFVAVKRELHLKIIINNQAFMS